MQAATCLLCVCVGSHWYWSAINTEAAGAAVTASLSVLPSKAALLAKLLFKRKLLLGVAMVLFVVLAVDWHRSTTEAMLVGSCVRHRFAIARSWSPVRRLNSAVMVC